MALGPQRAPVVREVLAPPLGANPEQPAPRSAPRRSTRPRERRRKGRSARAAAPRESPAPPPEAAAVGSSVLAWVWAIVASAACLASGLARLRECGAPRPATVPDLAPGFSNEAQVSPVKPLPERVAVVRRNAFPVGLATQNDAQVLAALSRAEVAR